MALAHEESNSFAPQHIQTNIVAESDHFQLTGTKKFVIDGHIASTFIVAGRSSNDEKRISLFLVPAQSAGVQIQRITAVDHRNIAQVHFEKVRVSKDSLLGDLGDGNRIIERIYNRSTAILSAEMLGGALESFERTLEYLKQRKQFGVLIGSFQALKHRAATIFCEIELSKSIIMAAAAAIDEDRSDLGAIISAAKARVTDTFLLAANEGIQMHGGIGVTDEHDIGLFLKRARVCEMTFGDAAYHRRRFATLNGY